MNGYWAIVALAAIEGTARIYALRTEPRRVTARAAAKAAAKGTQ